MFHQQSGGSGINLCSKWFLLHDTSTGAIQVALTSASDKYNILLLFPKEKPNPYSVSFKFSHKDEK